ncbi:MAG TPA: M12 family metallopeptidase [Methyloceanibacter sp.]|nr:M12 family metallopeptidase [Methyloceanibacter sp.]
MSQLRIAYFVSTLAILAAPPYAPAHDVKNPLAVDPSAKVELQVDALRKKMAAAEAAGVSPATLESARFVYWAGISWKNPVITVCFWNGSTELQNFVMDTAKVWSDNSGLTFSYQTDGQNNICQNAQSADIRVSLDDEDQRDLYVNQEESRKGDWSYLGDIPLPDYLVTLNLPDVVRDRENDPTWTHHAIRHEFGHALGLMHEHQRSLCDGWFNVEAIAENQGWTVDFARSQVGRFPDSDLAGLGFVGDYDKNSIMQYNFPKEWLVHKPGQSNPCLRQHSIHNLSPKDIAGIRVLYPRAAAGPNIASAQRAAHGQPRPTSAEDIAKERAKLTQAQATLQAKALQRSGNAEANAKASRAATALQDVITSLDQVESTIQPSSTTP